MEADSKTTRGWIGDSDSRTTSGWFTLFGGIVFYTIIKPARQLLQMFVTPRRG